MPSRGHALSSSHHDARAENPPVMLAATQQVSYPIAGPSQPYPELPPGSFAPHNNTTNSGLPFAMATAQPGPVALPPDPNSPEAFKQNLDMIQQQVLRVRSMARQTLDGINNAYQLGRTPAQTEADIATLKQATELLFDMLRQSGVGALPLLPPPPPSDDGSVPPAPPEEQLLVQTNRGLSATYDQLKRLQDAATIGMNLLGQGQTYGAVAGASHAQMLAQGHK
ncbi:unnamed protein product [Mycena citricolor]|uniref:Uncharacterized protein n=1 Tax=Mycena citricolor TaxID=2018698 RepID=A0AAD2HBC7_9AGAR|nr:unnamed protein product [Mycena citricolor]